MKSAIKNTSLLGMLVSLLALALGSPVSAHVVVQPVEAATASWQTFTVGAPNEKDIPTNEVKLLIPSGVRHVIPTQKAGWDIDIEKDQENNSAISITWGGGEIGVGLRDEFTFSAQVPDSTTELQWKAYQSYADGTVVAWDQEPEQSPGHDGDNGPYSVTSIVDETAAQSATRETSQAATDAKTAADRSLYAAIAGIVVGLVGVFLATRQSP